MLTHVKTGDEGRPGRGNWGHPDWAVVPADVHEDGLWQAGLGLCHSAHQFMREMGLERTRQLHPLYVHGLVQAMDQTCSCPG